ncbi:MAG: hypothetical protein ABI747_01670 [Candidatus Moraniibacteriota bacterium]
MAISPASLAISRAYRAIRKKKKEGNEKKLHFTGEKPSLFLYGAVGLIALLKDSLDFIIGPIPGVVTVVAFCLSFLIWMLLFLFDRSGGASKANRVLMQGMVISAVFVFEGVFVVLNYLPVETLSIFLLHSLARQAYKKEQEQAAKEAPERTKEERILAQQEAYALRQTAEAERMANEEGGQ